MKAAIRANMVRRNTKEGHWEHIHFYIPSTNLPRQDIYLRKRHDTLLSSLSVPGHDPVPCDSHVRVLIIVPVPQPVLHRHSLHSLQNAKRKCHNKVRSLIKTI